MADDERAIRAESKADRALSRIQDHEDVCAERYKGIMSDLKLLSQRVWQLLLFVAAGSVAVIIDISIKVLAK